MPHRGSEGRFTQQGAFRSSCAAGRALSIWPCSKDSGWVFVRGARGVFSPVSGFVVYLRFTCRAWRLLTIAFDPRSESCDTSAPSPAERTANAMLSAAPCRALVEPSAFVALCTTLLFHTMSNSVLNANPIMVGKTVLKILSPNESGSLILCMRMASTFSSIRCRASTARSAPDSKSVFSLIHSKCSACGAFVSWSFKGVLTTIGVKTRVKRTRLAVRFD